MPTRTRKSPGMPSTARNSAARFVPASRPYAAVSCPVSLISLTPRSTCRRTSPTIASMAYEATRPRATRVMQYVQRPAHPWAIGTIASLHPNEVDSISAARSPHAVPAPSNSTIWPLSRWKQFGSWYDGLHTVPLGRGHAARDDERLLVHRQLLHATRHLPLRRLDDSARYEDVSVRVGLHGRNRMAAPEQGLLHEPSFPVILGATVRFDVDLHGAAGRSGRYFRVARSAPHNSYPRARRSRRHGVRPGQRADVCAVAACRVPAVASAEGARARTPGSGKGGETATQSREGSSESEPTSGSIAISLPEGHDDGASRGCARRNCADAGPGIPQPVTFDRTGAGKSRFGGTT